MTESRVRAMIGPMVARPWFTLLPLLVCVGCGDGLHSGPDGSTPTPDAPVAFPDAPVNPDAPGSPDTGLADAVPPIDSALTPDGPPSCNPIGNYIELDDAGNDAIHGGSPEVTGMSITPANKTIGGCIDPQYATAEVPVVSDADVYSVTVSAENFFSGRIFSPAGPVADGAIVALVDSMFNVLTEAELSAGDTLIPPVFIRTGTYFVFVYHPGTGIAEPYTYGVDLKMLPCAPQTAVPNYLETADGATSRGNDVMLADWDPSFSDVTLSPTANTSDLPENTNIQVVFDRRRIDAVSARVSGQGDDYLDRDTFSFRTASNVHRVLAVVDWIGSNNDLDLFIVPENVIGDPIGGGTSLESSIERGGALVAPFTTYWIWVGNFVGSNPPDSGLYYRITLCGY